MHVSFWIYFRPSFWIRHCVRVNGSRNLQIGAGHSLAANRVGEITGATPVFVAASRHKYLFLAPIVAPGVAPLGTSGSIYVSPNRSAQTRSGSSHSENIVPDG